MKQIAPHPRPLSRKERGVIPLVIAILSVFVALSACARDASPEPPRATLTPIVRIVVADTATPRATATRTQTPTPAASNTPMPSPTPFITPPTEGDAAVIPILMYHQIKVLDASADDTTRTWTINPDQLRAQLDYIQAHGFHTITLPQMLNFFHAGAPLPTRPIVLTFDDAWIEHYTIAFSELQKRGMVGVFFVPTAFAQAGGQQRLDWDKVLQMDHGGMDIESHTINHVDLTKANLDEVRHQLVDAKKILEEKLGHPVIGFAYPYGAFNPQVVTATENAGYKAAVILCCGYKQRYDMMLRLPRIRVSYDDSLDAFAKRLP